MIKRGDKVILPYDWLVPDGTLVAKAGSKGTVIDIFPVWSISHHRAIKGYKVRFENGKEDWGTEVKKISS